jgi:hypothetical protein
VSSRAPHHHAPPPSLVKNSTLPPLFEKLPTDESAAYSPGATEYRLATFDPSWFVAFPTALGHDPSAFAPSATAPWLDRGSLVVESPTDRKGSIRHAPVDLGPFER